MCGSSLWPPGPYAYSYENCNQYLIGTLVWYVAAKITEAKDRQIFKMLGGFVSGHTLSV